MRKPYAVLALLIVTFIIPSDVLADTVIPYGTNISGNITWTKAASPYIVTGMGVAADGVLTIEPGTIVKFDLYGGMGVVGKLSVGAQIPAEPVIITSIRDDSVGGDSNGDGTASAPLAGDWNGIYLQGAGENVITNAVVRYGGKLIAPLILQSGSLLIDQSTISDALAALVSEEAGTLKLTNSTMLRAQYGVNSHTGATQFELASTTFHTLANSPVLIDGSVNFINHGGNNGEGGYELVGTLQGDQTWNQDGLPYLIQSYGTAAASSLTILSGTTVKFHQGGGMGVGGTFTVGSVTDNTPVIFTSIRDDGTFVPPAGDWNGVYLYSTSTIRNASFRYGGNSQGALNNLGGNVVISGGSIDKSGNVNFLQHAGTTTIDGTLIMNAPTGVLVDGGGVTIHNAKIAGNTAYGVNNISPQIVDATNNYWGAVDGPTHPIDPFDLTQGSGDAVSARVTYKPFQVLYGVPPASGCTVNCNSNVLFLPGIMGSRLFEKSSACGVFNNEKERWVSTWDCDHARLALDANGKSVNQIYTKEGNQGVIDDAYTLNMYQSFMHDLDSWKNSEQLITDYALIPYDWRLSLEDILQNGASSTDGTVRYDTSQGFTNSYIYKKLFDLSKTSRTEKVTIIAHSNGGLVTKALLQKLKDTNDPLYNKIDKVIFVAVPQTGTPEAISDLLHGDQIGLWGAVMKARRLRDLTHNMPGAYHLLPSTAYFNTVGTPIINFENGTATTPFIAHYGNTISNSTDLERFLRGDEGRPMSTYDDLDSPQVLQPNLLTYGVGVHAILDGNSWLSTSTTLIQIAGWGEETLAGITYRTIPNCLRVDSVVISGRTSYYCGKWGTKLTFDPDTVIDGDGTVVVPSALFVSTSTSNVQRYWVNLDKYNNDFPTSLSHLDRKHRDIFEVPNIRLFVHGLISSSSPVIDNFSNQSPASQLVSRLIFTLHSPLTLEFTDNLGHHTGPSTSTPEGTDFNVPGARYDRYGDVQMLSIPKIATGTLVLRGVATGSFVLDIKERWGNDIIASTSFEGIPSATNTLVSMNIDPSNSPIESGKLLIDQDGDGVTDLSLGSVLGSIVNFPPPDLTPPTTTETTTGTLGGNGWYTSNVLVTLTATDTGSGVKNTLYSLNNGVSWNTYATASPILLNLEGSTTLRFYSTDKAGNREATNTLVIKIDKTAPEASIAVSITTQDLLVTGTDSLGTTTVSKDASGNYSIIDQAGHTTKLFFTKTYSGKLLTYAKLTGIQYDNQSKITLPISSVLYVWDTKAPIVPVSQTIAVNDTYVIQALYNKQTNKTTVIVLKKNLPIQTVVFTGLEIVRLTTSTGVVGYAL